jgi:putative hydrolase
VAEPAGTVTKADVARTLHRIAHLLERGQASRYRAAAYRRSGDVIRDLPDDVWRMRVRDGRWRDLPGVGESTAQVITDVLEGRVPAVLAELEGDAGARRVSAAGQALRDAVRGDLHSHTEESDGVAPFTEMAVAAVEAGHEYLAVTDHSPRLTVANGLSPARLRAQIALIDRANEVLAPFRLLRGIEVDIHDDGRLDQEPALLGELDVVVASVHSKLRMDRAAMTRRMVAAVEQPWTDVLGHCTGRRMGGRRERPQSEFDPEAVFAACARAGVAVEVNCQPERQDPPDDLIDVAAEVGCLFSIDSDAHAPGELEWLVDGCERLAAHGVAHDRVVTTWPVERLMEWTSRR